MARHRLELPKSIIARLGKEPDTLLAAEAGCSKPVIARARSDRHIPPFGSAAATLAAVTPTPIHANVRAAFQGARVAGDGMLIPFDLFAKAAKEVL